MGNGKEEPPQGANALITASLILAFISNALSERYDMTVIAAIGLVLAVRGLLRVRGMHGAWKVAGVLSTVVGAATVLICVSAAAARYTW